MNKLGLVITIFLLISSPLRAATVYGNLVLKYCETVLQFTDKILSNTDPGDSTGVGFCVGMLEGVTYTMTLLSDGAVLWLSIYLSERRLIEEQNYWSEM